MTIKQVKNHAAKLYKCMDWQDVTEDEKRVVIVKREGQEHEELLKITFNVSEETHLSMDSVYRFTMEALGLIADSSAETEDDLRDAGLEIEADVYTSDLTNWLGESNYHVDYLTSAIENGADNGFNALAMAQAQAKQEVFDCVLGQLLEQ